MTDNQPDRQQILFLSLVQSLVSSAWIHLGKIKNPGTESTTVKLDEASVTIDMLEMLLNKTQGNLSDDEKRYLERSLSDLKMNFVEVKLKTPATEKSTDQQSQSTT